MHQMLCTLPAGTPAPHLLTPHPSASELIEGISMDLIWGGNQPREGVATLAGLNWGSYFALSTHKAQSARDSERAPLPQTTLDETEGDLQSSPAWHRPAGYPLRD